MKWAICHKSGTVLFTTSDERTMLNRKSQGWIIKVSTISNERLGAFILGSQPWNEEIEQMATELLALRKEREKAEPFVCPKCGNTGLADSGGVKPWGEPILIECDCTAPPAPVVPAETFDEWSRRCEIQLTLCRPEFREVAEITWNACRAAMLK